jgi:dTDP-4-amino-4,6-dideoxygalactose transaminase
MTSTGFTLASEHPKNVLHTSETIRAALARLDVVQPKLCIVVDSDGTLIRTISDGDIRRGLLRHVTLDSAISELPGRAPVHANVATSEEKLLNLMKQEGVNAVVLIDDGHRPVGLKSVTDLQEHILLSPPHIGENETNYVKQAFDTNWIAPVGPNIENFEQRLAEINGRSEAVAVSSGTAGLHLALRVLELPDDTPVYVSDKTFVASLQPILYERLRPVLIDAEPVSWNMSPDALERRLTRDAADGSLPGAIILVHLYGQPAQLDRILPLAERYGIPIIEDAAESLGASYMNRPSGSHGLLGVYSFNGNKIITTSTGGGVVTDDAKLAKRIRYLATQGRDPFEHYQHSQVAYNYRMSNILAGVGLGQLEVLADRVARRRAIHARYREGLGTVPGIGFQEETAGGNGNRWLTVITLDPDRIAIHPYQLMRALQRRGIETRPSWKPMHMQPLCHNFEFVPHSEHEVVSSSLYLTALCLPSGSNLSDAQIDRIISSLLDVVLRGNS